MTTRVLVAQGEPALARFKVGNWYTPGLVSSTNLWANGDLLAEPFPVGETTTFDRLAIGISSAGTAGSVVRLGIYADDGDGLPGALVLDAGTVVGTGTGFIELAISQSLTPGLYFLAAVPQGAPATAPTLYVNSGSQGNPLVSDATLSNLMAGARNGYFRTGQTGALPNPFGTPGGSTNLCTLIAARAA